MGLNFQDVLRDVHDPSQHTLKTTTSLSASTVYVGNPTLYAVVNTGGANTGNITLNPGPNYIGLVSATITNSVGNATLNPSPNYIGLVTAWTRNAGTAKSLAPLTVTLSITSVATIVVPTNANVIYVTNILLNANATVRVSIKSGVTYLTGNASIGVALNPGGGLVNAGSPDSPAYIGLPSGALVIEKSDITTNVSGSLIYFQE